MKKTSKKVFVLMIMLISLFALSSVALADEEDPLSGGWTEAEDKTITAERKDLFEKAILGLTGATYEPVSYEASQVVAGTNHKFTANRTMVVPNAEPVLVEIIIYEDLSGNVSVSSINEINNKDDDGKLSGGWEEAKDPTVTEELKGIFELAFTGMTGATYEPVSFDASQVVAGMNYLFTAYRTYVTPGAEKQLVKVTIYVDTNGTATVTDIVEVEPAKDDPAEEDPKKDEPKENTPPTGDSVNIVVLAILALACAAVVALIASRRRQRL
ncbi:MAG: hypothetical protein J6Y20_13450 [Lachnospiraceae bacterium]|nr:hypothetical protein [Lachnospiraceae bacterium]